MYVLRHSRRVQVQVAEHRQDERRVVRLHSHGDAPAGAGAAEPPPRGSRCDRARACATAARARPPPKTSPPPGLALCGKEQGRRAWWLETGTSCLAGQPVWKRPVQTERLARVTEPDDQKNTKVCPFSYMSEQRQRGVGGGVTYRNTPKAKPYSALLRAFPALRYGA